MKTERVDLLKIYKQLYNYFGPQNWWPAFCNGGDKRFEICLGAILTQNTAWTNVEKAIINLYKNNLMSPNAILQTKSARLAKLIKQAGYYNQKAKKLKIFSRFFVEHKNFDELKKISVKKLRQDLLSVWGIGRETADSIILYAVCKPVFVIDVYTKRMLNNFNIQFENYDEYRSFFESRLPKSTKLWNEYHALIVAWGKINNKDENLARKIMGLSPNALL